MKSETLPKPLYWIYKIYLVMGYKDIKELLRIYYNLSEGICNRPPKYTHEIAIALLEKYMNEQ